jgi:tetratricopeptide (TPR) repeat protein
MTGQAGVASSPRSVARPLHGMCRRRAGWPLLLAWALLAATPLRAQAPAEDDTSLRNRALELWKQGNQADALPLLEKVAVARPTDTVVLESLGEALMREGRTEEAKAKFMDAIVAEPYQQTSWVGLKQWAKATHATVEQPKIEPPVSVRAEGDGKININIDPKSLDKKNGDLRQDPLFVAYPEVQEGIPHRDHLPAHVGRRSGCPPERRGVGHGSQE